jgi:DNA-binding MarR family transcriptional regulator
MVTTGDFLMDSQLIEGLSRIATVLRHEAWAVAAPAGVTPTQGQILALLNARPKESMRVADVARHLAITLPTVSDSVRVLAEKKLIRKERAPDDGRAIQLTLTRRGQQIAQRTARWPDFLLAASNSLSETEQAVFRKALIKIIRDLQRQGRIPLARMCSQCLYFRPFAHPDSGQPHHCDYVNAPFGDAALRLDCEDFEAAPEREQASMWARFVQLEPARSGHGSQPKTNDIQNQQGETT